MGLNAPREMRRDHRGSSMKNTNKLFGRRLTKLILTPVLSIGLVAGFAVTPTMATMGDDNPYGGEIEIVRTGNSFDWSAWINEAREFGNPGDRETAFDASVSFFIVACQESSVSITDCMGGTPGLEETRGKFVGILNDFNLVTTTTSDVAGRTSPLNGSLSGSEVRSIEINQSGKTSSAVTWLNSADGMGSPLQLPTAGYKMYVFMWLKNYYNANAVYGNAAFIEPYYVSAPISVDFRPLSATPTISAQPASASKSVGDALSLSVTAAGAGTLSYQWKKGGTAISGATSATYSIPSVATSDAGSYTVDVINTESNKAPVTVTSNAAVVTVAASTASPSASSPSTGTSSTVAPVVTCKIAKGKKLAKTCLITASGSVVPKKAKVSLKVAKANQEICKVQGTKIKALKPGTCTVSVKVKPKKGKTITKTTVVTVS